MKFPVAFAIFLLMISCSNEKTADTPATKSIQIKKPAIKKAPHNPYQGTDASPLDMSYFPDDYPKLKMNGQAKELPKARVIYSRPHRQERRIFGSLVKYGEPWRLGANEATEIEFFQPVTIQDKKINKGRYILYAIPHEDRWEIILNSDVYTWGLKIDSSKDVAKFSMPVEVKNQMLEYFTMVFKETEPGADLIIAWESSEVRLPIQF